MKRIGLISDTHGWLDPALKDFLKDCDEIWHAGDIGSLKILDELKSWNDETRIVFGNIDAQEIRLETIKDLWFECEDMSIYITHIGGYPGRYNRRMKEVFKGRRPDIFICGHSHILKVIYDKKYQFLHMNPGACGNIGFHPIRTALRFSINGKDVKDMEIIELGKRG